MTPEEARHEVNRDLKTEYARVDFNRHCAGEKALETIANMTWEYGISNGESEMWCPTQTDAEDMHGIYAYQGITVRLVRRMVSAPHEVTE